MAEKIKQIQGKNQVRQFETVPNTIKKQISKLFQISPFDWLFPRKPKQPI
ncbi:hypothetical protein [Algoriphagus formosus]|nr:hypothetical protein [Algoriphagus aquimaris]